MKLALRYLIASSGFWNWALAGRAASRPVAVHRARQRRFIGRVLRSDMEIRRDPGVRASVAFALRLFMTQDT
ncbi:hypothetical protein MASR2M32_04010 [Sphaerotilus sulfidivorans]